MDNIIKQIRVRFSTFGDENKDDSYNRRALKGERKQGQKRQFSGQMNDLEELSDYEFETAIGAAAFAISSLDDGEGNIDWKRSNEELTRSLTKTRSRREDISDKPSDYSKISQWSSIKEVNVDGKSPGDNSMRKPATLDQKLKPATLDQKLKPATLDQKLKPATLDQKLPEYPTTDQKAPEKAMATPPTIKKTPTFSDGYLNDAISKRFEQEQDPRKGKNDLSTMKPTTASTGNRKWAVNTSISSEVEAKANSWEKAKMAKIKKRYEKLISTILEWENEKKMKAKRQMERKEREIEERRARVLQEYRNEMSRIDKIANGARAAADEGKKNDEDKTIDKANVLRSTGKLPSKCICF